jgi:hypothetical protein
MPTVVTANAVSPLTRRHMGISVPAAPSRRISLDSLGVTASVACAVHCVVVALAMGVLPVASRYAAPWFASPWIEWVFLAVSVAIGLAALVPGYARHELTAPLRLFACGVSILVALRALQVQPSLFEMAWVLVAAACVVTAHWKNRGALHRCSCGPAHH